MINGFKLSLLTIRTFHASVRNAKEGHSQESHPIIRILDINHAIFQPTLLAVIFHFLTREKTFPANNMTSWW